MATNQVSLDAQMREQLGKGPTGRLRREGRTPGILYGQGVEPTSVSVDALALYHALHGPAGTNVLIHLEISEGPQQLAVARDIQRHAVRGDVTHVDFLAVDKDTLISVEVPLHVIDDEDVTSETGGVVNTVLYTVPILVSPMNVPNFLEISVLGMEIGDVRRVEDLRVQLPEGGEFDIDPERTIVTVNPPDILEEPEDEDAELAEGEELPEGEEAAADASEVPADGEGPTNDSDTQ